MSEEKKYTAEELKTEYVKHCQDLGNKFYTLYVEHIAPMVQINQLGAKAMQEEAAAAPAKEPDAVLAPETVV